MLGGLSNGGSDGNALRPFFLTERPRIAILKGDEIWSHLGGLKFDCEDQTFPLRQTSYEADGATRYGVDMIAEGFAILAKASGKPADEDAGK
jgi:hypothetical protein